MQGQLSEAIACQQWALDLRPDYPEAHNNLGSAYKQQGDWERAVVCYQQAVSLRPHYAEAHNNLGTILGQQEKYEQAIGHFQQAIACKPNYVEAYSNLATAKQKQEKYDEAVAYYQQAIALDPHKADIHNNMANALARLGKLSEASARFRQAVSLNPTKAEYDFNLAAALQEQKNFPEAVNYYQQAIGLKPDYGQAYNNLGTLLQEQGQLTEAIDYYHQTLKWQPGFAEAYNNLGSAYQERGKIAEAIASYREAIGLQPDYGEAHKNLGMVLLLSGDLPQGWAEYEWRWRSQAAHPEARAPSGSAQRRAARERGPDFQKEHQTAYNRPRWDGSSLQGRTILLDAEQGFGDMIQFIRYAKAVGERGGRVLFTCPELLLRLFRSIPDISQLLITRDELPDFDVWAPLMSLPYILGTTLETIPAPVPYLHPGEEALKCLLRTEALKCLLRTEALRTGNIKVGIVWSSKPNHPTGRMRSCSLRDFLSLLELPDISFFSLQKGPQVQALSSGEYNIVNLDEFLYDFADTAAVIQHLDLVITVDTAVAHLAGALGKPVWTLLPFAPDWRWMRDRTDSPWYPTMRLFRQSQPRDWTRVFVEVKAALESWSRNRVSEAITSKSSYLSLEKPGFCTSASLTQKEIYDLEAELRIALAHHQAGKLQDAERIYRQILSTEPDNADAIQLLGAIAHQRDKLEEAVDLYNQALQLRPDYPEAHNNLAITLQKQGKITEAIGHYQRAIALKPDYAEYYCNLGTAFQTQDRITEAIACYDKALALNQGDDAKVYNNVAAAKQSLGQVQEAIGYFRQALALKADYAEAHKNLGMALLLSGDLQQGFAEYEWRWQCPEFASKYRDGQSPPHFWDGSDLQGRTVLLECEQGYGDAIQFIRYVPLVQAQGGNVIVKCRQPLVKLFQTLPGIGRVVEQKSPVPAFDLHLPLMSLPHILGTTLETVPAQVPYFHPPRTGETPVLGRSDKFKVGIVWAGSKGNNQNHIRSISLAQLLPILELEDIQFYSLQKEEAVRELATVRNNIISLDDRIADFADTAAIIQQLDLVITVDTAVAHLAGALGKRVWVLLPFVPDWRWLLERPDSPWYPTMRLFRQPQLGDWQNVVEQVRSALQSLIADRPSNPALTNDNLTSMLDLAVAHHQGGRLSAAADIYRQVLQQDPENADAIHLLGEIAYQTGDRERAIANYQKSLNINPENADALNNLAATLQQQGKLDEAIGYYRQALSLKPQSPKILCNIGATLIEQGKVEEAIWHLRQVLVLDPHYAHGHYNLAMALLLSGDLQQGFAEYEWRWQCPEIARQTPSHSLSVPLWDGTPSPGRTLLLYKEQGLGDSIQFIRYVPSVKQLGGRVIVACPQALKRLFSTMPGIDRLITDGEPLPEFHLRAPFMSLPRLLGTVLETIPAQVPYLHAREGEALKRLLRTSDKFKVGIVWASKPNHPTSRKRSCDLNHFLQLLSLPNITLYSLQKDLPQPPELQDNKNIIFLGEQLHDFADTAAIIQALDLVITVDTSVAHLAGALGKPVWVLLPFAPNWRWMRERSDSPWYPTMRLFRQAELGDWSGVFVRVHKALHELISVLTLDSQDSGDRTYSQNLGALLNTAVAHHQSGRLQAAEQLYWQILRSSPDPDTRSTTLYLLGTVGHQSGKLDLAISYYQQSLAWREDKAEVHNNLAIALQQVGKVNEAIGHYQRALTIQPNYPEVHSNLGNAWRDLGKINEAIGHYRAALALRPDYPEAYCNLADTLKKQGNLDEAISAYQQVLALRPDMAESHNFMAQALAEKEDFAAAIGHYRRALDLRPDDADAYNNLGVAYYQQGNVAEAIDCYLHAIALRPNYAYARKNLGIAMLISGDLKRGFAEYEWRWQCPDFVGENPLPSASKLRWQGEDLQGKTILIYCEQGLGDSIQFIRYLPKLQQLGGKAVVGCHRSLKQLFSTVAGIERVVTTGDPFPEFDCYVPLLSLPHLLGTTLETIPAQVPYLYPRTGQTVIRNLVSGPIDKLKVGIAWATQLNHPAGRKRSCSLKDFLQMLDLPSLEIYSLQKEMPEPERQTLLKSNIVSMDEMLNDFADTATLCDQLDLAITVDTSIAHLAGALGKPVWVLLPFIPDWRWMLSCADSPWYPTMQLFRQQQPGDWSEVFLTVQRALRSFLADVESQEDDRLLTIATNLAYPTVGSGMRQLRAIVTNTQSNAPLHSGRDDKRPVTGDMHSFW